MNNIITVNDMNFDENVLSIDESTYVIVDFNAKWCSPCKSFAKTFENASEEFGEFVKFVSADVDETSEYTNKFSIKSIPCLLMIKNGLVIDRITGNLSETELKNFIISNISSECGECHSCKGCN